MRKMMPDSAVTFFSIFGALLLCGPERALWGLLLLTCLLARVQSPTQKSNKWINRLKFYELQLGDPYPYQDLMLGPS